MLPTDFLNTMSRLYDLSEFGIDEILSVVSVVLSVIIEHLGKLWNQLFKCMNLILR